MSFAGHVLDMIKRQKSNRKLQRQNRKKYVEKKKSLTSKAPKRVYNVRKYSQLSAVEIADNKKNIRRLRNKENRSAWIKTIVTVTILLALLYMIVK